eukprot:13082426-Alexandrium_andersonii.AAC.1
MLPDDDPRVQRVLRDMQASTARARCGDIKTARWAKQLIDSCERSNVPWSVCQSPPLAVNSP